MVRRRPCASRFARARLVAAPVVLSQVAPGGVVALPRRRARAGILVPALVRSSASVTRTGAANRSPSLSSSAPPRRGLRPGRGIVIRPARVGVEIAGRPARSCPWQTFSRVRTTAASSSASAGGEAELRQRDRHEVGRLDQGRRSRPGTSARVGSTPREPAPVQRRRGRRRRSHRSRRRVAPGAARPFDGGRPAPPAAPPDRSPEEP